MATGSASRSSQLSTASDVNLDLVFSSLSTDCETWLTGPEDISNVDEKISTQEWLDGALKNSQYDHTKLHRIMQSQKKQRKKLAHDIPSHSNTLLTSVTEEHDKSNSISDISLPTTELINDSDEEFFDASTSLDDMTGRAMAARSNQSCGSLPKKSQNYSPRTVSADSSPRPIIPSLNLAKNKSPHELNVIGTAEESKHLSPNISNGIKRPPQRETSLPNDASNSKYPSPNITNKISVVMNKSGIPSPLAGNASHHHHKSVYSPPSLQSVSTELEKMGGYDTSFIEMSRKVEEQEKKLREQALHGKKVESRPSSSASTNEDKTIKEIGENSTVTIPTSKSVDFKGVARLATVGRSTSTRIPMYGRTASVSSTLNRMPKPRPNIPANPSKLAYKPPKENSNDPWGDNCF